MVGRSLHATGDTTPTKALAELEARLDALNDDINKLANPIARANLSDSCDACSEQIKRLKELERSDMRSLRAIHNSILHLEHAAAIVGQGIASPAARSVAAKLHASVDGPVDEAKR